MMNMFQLQERIKDFSKDQLVREMQQPSGSIPPFLVLSELQRRTRMEKAFQAEQAQGQQPTVAQDAVAAAGVPQGGIADMARAMAPQTDMAGNTGAAPVQQMREGGVVRMQPGGLAGVSRDVGAFSPEMGAAAVRPRPRLVVRNGIQYAQMPDGSLIPIGMLGFSAEDQAGAGTADLAPPAGFPAPDTGPLPTQADLDQRFAERELGITGTARQLTPPTLSDVAQLPDIEAPVSAARRAPDMPTPARDMETPLVASLTGESGLDIRPPPSISAAPFTISDEELAAIAGVSPGGIAPVQGPNRPLWADGPSVPSEEELAAIAGVSPGVMAPVQGPNLPRPPVNPSEFGGLPDFMVEQRGTVPEPQRGQGIMPSDIGRAVGEAVGFGPAMDVARATRATPAPLPMDTGTALAVPEEADGGIEALLPPPAPTTPPQTSGGAGGAGGAGRGFDIDRMLEQDKWLALAQFGLGLMASQQPTLGGAVGEAGTAALGQLGKAREAAVERDLAERTLAVRAAAGRNGSLSASNLVSLRADLVEELGGLTGPMGKQLTAPELERVSELRNTIAGLDRMLGLDAIGSLGNVSSDTSAYRLPSATR